MRKPFLNYAALMSCVVLLLAAGLLVIGSVGSVWGKDGFTLPFMYHKQKWQVELSNGRLIFSNAIFYNNAENLASSQRRLLVEAIESARRKWREDCETARKAGRALSPEPGGFNYFGMRAVPLVEHEIFLPGVAGYASILPTLWYVLLLVNEKQRRRRKAGGLCIKCGYDLRVTPGQCPECGQLTATKAKLL